MSGILRPIALLILLALALHCATAPGQDADTTRAKLFELRQRLGKLKPGMTMEEVLQALGKPDEVRRVPEDDLLDGTRLLGDIQGIGPETERWAYGITGKGMFARVGYVSIDRNRKVVAAVPADRLAGPLWSKLPELDPPAGEQAAESPGKMTCQVGPVKFHPQAGKTAERFEATVTLKNAGTKPFKLQHDAASSLRRFLIVEVCDSTGTVLWREDEMSYHSPVSADQAKWPVLSVDAGSQVAESLPFSPSQGFGRLPVGKYSLRVYFPFEGGRFYPSNLVSFEVKRE
jgi:hypothetical protein